MEDRIVELEIKIAHQERLLTDLDDVVRAFTRRVEDLERVVKELRESAGSIDVGPANEPPPHY